MNAINFVKDKGLLFAIDVLQNSPDDFPEIVVDSDGVSYGIGLVPFVGGYHILRDDLKKIVEAFELVERFGGFDKSNKMLKKAYDNCSSIISIRKIGFECSYSDLQEAINLLEQSHD